MSAGTGTPPRPLLAVNNIEVIYDHVILVLRGVSLTVPEGGIVALLGANGAGKSTTLKAISGLLRTERGDVTKGSIEFRGEAIHRRDPGEVVRRGIVNAMYTAEAIRTAQGKFGKGGITGEQMRWGLENLNLTDKRLEEIGMKGFTHAVKVTCEDHEGNGPILVQQWDGKKWTIVSDWISPMRDVVRPKIEAAAIDEAKKLNYDKRDCSKEK